MEDVPDDTRLWNPDTAPQATVTNRIGKRVPRLSFWNPVNAGRFMDGCAKISPSTAPAIIPTNIKVDI